MRDCIIGQPVVCSAYSTMEYDTKDNRLAVDHKCEPFNGVIVGRKIQPLGKYCSGGAGGMYGEDCEPPCLSVSGTMEFWEVRTGWRNRPLLVRDEHLSYCAAFRVPMQSHRPKVLAEQVAA